MKKIYLLAIMGIFILISARSDARVMPSPSAVSLQPMKPPTDNPHPPQTVQDKARVAFAQKVIDLFLAKPFPGTFNWQVMPPPMDKSLSCLEQPSCYSKDPGFVNDLVHIHADYGELIEASNIHVVPASPKAPSSPVPNAKPGYAPRVNTDLPSIKDNEYIIHAYAHFSRNKELWMNVYLVVTDDSEHHILLRRLLVTSFIPMPPC